MSNTIASTTFSTTVNAADLASATARADAGNRPSLLRQKELAMALLKDVAAAPLPAASAPSASTPGKPRVYG